MPKEDATGLAQVKKWMADHKYSCMGGDNIPYILTCLQDQIYQRVKESQQKTSKMANTTQK